MRNSGTWEALQFPAMPDIIDSQQPAEPEADQELHGFFKSLVVIASVYCGVALTWIFVDGLRSGLVPLCLRHLPTVFGLPCAALASLTLVLLLRTVQGNIRLSGLGFEFRGASGPILMWILCFLAITFAVVKTWELETPLSANSGSNVSGPATTNHNNPSK